VARLLTSGFEDQFSDIQEASMFLKEKSSGNTVEVLYLSELFSLYDKELQGRYCVGEDVLVAETFKKSDLMFTSGEELPKCWLDPHYRDDELKR
jgi:hypothetical protein